MPVSETPTILPQWVALRAPDSAQRWFVSLHELIRHSGAKLFPGMEILGHTLFRVLRNAEVGLEEEEGETVFEAVTDALRERRFSRWCGWTFRSIRFPRYGAALERFKLTEDDELPGLLDYSGLFQIASLDLPNLRDPNWSPLPLARIPTDDVDIFSVIQAGDLLVHHPYESFDLSVEQFISDAADDPQTVAIKMTVYRVGDEHALCSLAHPCCGVWQAGGLPGGAKARFDEARNLHWARAMEKVGAHVVYGVRGLKTHTQARAGGEERRPRAEVLRPHRHRQLPRENGTPYKTSGSSPWTRR